MCQLAEVVSRPAVSGFAHSNAFEDADRRPIGVERFGPDFVETEAFKAVQDSGGSGSTSVPSIPVLASPDDEPQLASFRLVAVEIDVPDELTAGRCSAPKERVGRLRDHLSMELARLAPFKIGNRHL